MDIQLLNQIKRLVVIALASDDTLMEQLVLKGGNAIDLVYHQSDKLSRASFDLDYSIQDGNLEPEALEELKERAEKTIRQTFMERGFEILDYKFTERPKIIRKQLAPFWGGYAISFKIIQTKDYNRLGGNRDKARLSAIALNRNNSPVFQVEISKYEYTERKVATEVDGYKIYVYSPEMIAFEKIRALCQQLPEYAQVVPSHSPRGRARDFYDIYYIMDTHQISLAEPQNQALLENIFSAKRVPVDFLQRLRSQIDFHRTDWQSVVDTLPQDDELKNFDFYAEYVLTIAERYIPLG